MSSWKVVCVMTRMTRQRASKLLLPPSNILLKTGVGTNETVTPFPFASNAFIWDKIASSRPYWNVLLVAISFSACSQYFSVFLLTTSFHIPFANLAMARFNSLRTLFLLSFSVRWLSCWSCLLRWRKLTLLYAAILTFYSWPYDWRIACRSVSNSYNTCTLC